MSLSIARSGTGEPCPGCGATATCRVPASPAHPRCLRCGDAWDDDEGARAVPDEAERLKEALESAWHEAASWEAEANRLRDQVERLRDCGAWWRPLAFVAKLAAAVVIVPVVIVVGGLFLAAVAGVEWVKVRVQEGKAKGRGGQP